MKAYTRIGNLEVDYEVLPNGRVKVTLPSGDVKEWSPNTFHIQCKKEIREKSTVEKVKKPCFYQHKLSPLGNMLLHSGVIKYPFPKDISTYILGVSESYKSLDVFPSTSKALRSYISACKRRFDKQLKKCEESVKNAEMYSSLSMLDYNHIKAGEILWAQDHCLRACVEWINVRDAQEVLESLGEEEEFESVKKTSKELPPDVLETRLKLESIRKEVQNG
jgi:hypothetical protein